MVAAIHLDMHGGRPQSRLRQHATQEDFFKPDIVETDEPHV